MLKIAQNFVLSLGLSLSSSLLLAGQAVAGNFTFTLIADVSGSFFPHGPSINDSGTVAFFTFVNDDFNQGIAIGNGGAITTIVDNLSLGGAVSSSFSLNDNGTVAFTDGSTSLYIYDDGSITPIFDDGSLFYVNRPSLNNNGQIAFRAFFGDIREGIFLSDGDSISTIATEGERGPSFGQVSLNDNGIIAYGNNFDSIIVRQSSVFFDLINLPRPYNSLNSFTLNNSDTIAFDASQTGIRGRRGIFTSTEGTLTNIVNESGPFSSFGAVNLNDKGSLAFSAFLDAGGQGIFMGPDFVEDKVIATGDPLLGSTVRFLNFDLEALNNKGQLAFLATLADGREVVVRANPIPEPLTILGVGTATIFGVFFKKKSQRKNAR